MKYMVIKLSETIGHKSLVTKMSVEWIYMSITVKMDVTIKITQK